MTALAIAAFERESDARRRAESGEPTPEQMEAREALYAEMLKHGPAPSTEEIDAVLGSWR